MKKVSRIMMMLVLCLAFLVIPTGCKSEIKSHKLKPGTLTTSVVQNDVVDTSKVVVIYTYSNGDTKEVGAKDLKFSQVDTSVVTESAKLTISYGDYSFDVTIKVRASADDINDIASFTSTSNDIYNDNITTNSIGFYNHSYNSQKDTEDGSEDKYLGIEPRYVGTDNPFIMDLKIDGYDAEGNTAVGLENVSTIIKVELINDNNTYTELTETSTPTLASMVSVSSTDAKFKFTKAAEGKAFRVTVEPKNKMEGVPTALKVVAELHVIEGFNVHDAKDLAVYDNSGRDYDMDGKADWNDIKTAVGVKYDMDNITTYVPKNVILQNNIDIKDEDVPSTMFWSKANIKFEHDKDNSTDRVLSKNYEAANSVIKIKGDNRSDKLAGSMVDRDKTGIYHYNFTQEGGEINMIGNYFTISCRDLSRAVVQSFGTERGSETNPTGYVDEENDVYMTMHSTLFCHTYMDEDDDDQTGRYYTMDNDCEINWKNVNFTGNGSTSDEEKYSGSIILFKSYRVNCDVYNCVSTNFAINYLFAFGETDCDKDGEYRLDYCKGEKSYQALIFSNGAEHVLVTNSEFKEANGPAIISVLNCAEDWDDYVGGNETKAHEFWVSSIDVVSSTIESLVSGEEPWFQVYGADTQIKQLVAIEGILSGSAMSSPVGTSKSMLNPGQASEGKQLFNLQVLSMRDGDISFTNFMKSTGYARFFDGENGYSDYVNYYNDQNRDIEKGLVMNGTTALLPATHSQGMIFEDDNGTWFSQAIAEYVASDDFLLALGKIQQSNPQPFMNLFSDSNYLDIYLINGMGARMQLYPRS